MTKYLFGPYDVAFLNLAWDLLQDSVTGQYRAGSIKVGRLSWKTATRTPGMP